MIGAQHRGRERRLRRADGETIWVRTTASIVHREGRLAYAIAHIADITAAKRAEEELTGQALHDPLTGLANRNLLMDHVALALDLLRRNDDAVAVLYLDLDRFKDVNDKHGHEVGDEVLSEVGARLAATVRAPDTAARLGGDEFVVVCTGITDDLAATGIADRLEAALAEPVRVDGAELEVGASIGVTTTRWSSTDPDELLRQADMAMYQAKRNGGHRWEMYDQSFRNHALARLSVQSDLRAAIDEHWLRHYQPVVDLTAGRIVGCEALLRIAHPERGLL